ncbi:hypothetical protein AAHB60_20240 [Pseudomonas aeruginosa]
MQTEYVAEYAALVATRRLRSGTETPVWAAHFAVVEGSLTAPVEYESDRARFLGRGRTLRDVLADLRQPLSGSAGTVLDPVSLCAGDCVSRLGKWRGCPSGSWSLRPARRSST